jgi:hypothetical protein
MKKLIMLSLVGAFTLSSFTVKSPKKVVVKMQYFTVRCNGVISGYFACDGCDAYAVGRAMCG